MSEIYRTISDDEFRGERFFDAFVRLRFWHSKPLLVQTTPRSYKAAFHSGEKLIVEAVDNDYFAVRGVWRKGIIKDPYPNYLSSPVEFRLHKRYLDNIQPRMLGVSQ